eukprot:TRINITY_DN45105_c0_g1_i5.p1 TRINITY_DN45105_c0_g1~~TRINITY_DN45105_c0_g1_i5.p1  ORF type:complete len:291 (-),score=54.88 TRINITY_DN45105_c0_g1_i5:1949-2821(-)
MSERMGDSFSDVCGATYGASVSALLSDAAMSTEEGGVGDGEERIKAPVSYVPLDPNNLVMFDIPHDPDDFVASDVLVDPAAPMYNVHIDPDALVAPDVSVDPVDLASDVPAARDNLPVFDVTVDPDDLVSDVCVAPDNLFFDVPDDLVTFDVALDLSALAVSDVPVDTETLDFDASTDLDAHVFSEVPVAPVFDTDEEMDNTVIHYNNNSSVNSHSLNSECSDESDVTVKNVSFEYVKFLSLNVGGLLGKVHDPEFCDVIFDNDIVCLTETKLDDLDNIDIDGFTCFTKK